MLIAMTKNLPDDDRGRSKLDPTMFQAWMGAGHRVEGRWSKRRRTLGIAMTTNLPDNLRHRAPFSHRASTLCEAR
jgi:hypothetical protein